MLTWILSCCPQWLDSSSDYCLVSLHRSSRCLLVTACLAWLHGPSLWMSSDLQTPKKISPGTASSYSAHLNLEAINFLSDNWHTVPLQICHHVVTLVQTTVWNHWLDLGQINTQRTIPSTESIPYPSTRSACFLSILWQTTQWKLQWATVP